jgi:hypothetical protein
MHDINLDVVRRAVVEKAKDTNVLLGSTSPSQVRFAIGTLIIECAMANVISHGKFGLS